VGGHLSDNQLGELGHHHVLYSRCSLVLGLDLLCFFDCSKQLIANITQFTPLSNDENF